MRVSMYIRRVIALQRFSRGSGAISLLPAVVVKLGHQNRPVQKAGAFL